jgi:hypothetical protein
MTALTPGQRLFVPSASGMNTSWICPGLSDSWTRPSRRSVAMHLTRLHVAFARYPSARGASEPVRSGWPDAWVRSGLHLIQAGSPTRPAESRSSSYGPTVHLQLLSTSPRGDAVTFSYRPENVCREGTCTPRIESTLRRTWIPAFAGMTVMRLRLFSSSPGAAERHDDCAQDDFAG